MATRTRNSYHDEVYGNGDGAPSGAADRSALRAETYAMINVGNERIGAHLAGDRAARELRAGAQQSAQ